MSLKSSQNFGYSKNIHATPAPVGISSQIVSVAHRGLQWVAVMFTFSLGSVYVALRKLAKRDESVRSILAGFFHFV